MRAHKYSCVPREGINILTVASPRRAPAQKMAQVMPTLLLTGGENHGRFANAKMAVFYCETRA